MESYADFGAWARDDDVNPITLITGARIFDGVSDTLIEGQDVLVRGGKIARIGADIAAPDGARVIDAAGRVMSPGFTDVHYHLSLCSVPIMGMAGSGAPDLGPVRLAKGRMVMAGLDQMFELAKRYELKIAFGTDVVVNPEACADQNREFVERTKWFTPVEVLRQATSLSGELLQLSGERSPYPGKIGVIEEGAHADILLIDGNPLEDISILQNYDETLDMIMKGGVIHKDAL